MDVSLTSQLSLTNTKTSSQFSSRFHKPLVPCFINFSCKPHTHSLITGYYPIRSQSLNQTSTSINDVDDGFVLEDVPHLTNFLPNLPVILTTILTFLSQLNNF